MVASNAMTSTPLNSKLGMESEPNKSSTSRTIQCSSPSKLILSGEHAVLYNSPALSMAVDLKTNCKLKQTQSDTTQFTLNLNDFGLKKNFSLVEWQVQTQQIEQRFQKFQHDQLKIDDVLSSPFDLILICLWVFNQHHQITTANWLISIQSEVPIGRGLGSSAAVIVTILSGLLKLHTLPDSNEILLDLAKQVESYQHGRSSGLDPATLIYGGLLKYQIDQPIQRLPSPPPLSAWLIDTGAPQSHTGECVQTVKQQHQHNTPLWQDFKEVVAQIEQTWLQQDNEQLKIAIKRNHNLLCEIGVVPNKVKQFIQELDATLSSASKVCGAGSVLGENAGIVLCLADQAPTELCQLYGYAFWPLKLQSQGVHCVLD